MGKNIKVYSTPTCPYCIRLKDYLKENNVDFKEYDVGKDQEALRLMKEKSGQLGVPVIDIDDKIIVGFDQAAVAQELGL